ncbi:LysR family transcriptional regulator [Mycolicibacterium smegmatis]|uniref:Probable hydrogen peroxide-inducible genes activator n=2 Tax=Mycolicibacterium smegmatis TaxID=1772 RepID=A0R3Z8_MYCS2|nr:LysR family transcriptional regulator [Mycolicibacterium smegmatis]ABK70665.1 transcriptional regulator, LysR family protein [Mycolicibacterium smegmatis MC2 155]AIU10670.1 LysR family transcriptional regulator [Mycolicibacterium smegmatis MC2 155]AIU17295.1 LysR family transcriptional regulator [Mycolicibacterium smegmatis]AIU23918.1 LysR family transcriptional regulator [Mycolicibacterium smegmatis]AWT56492.1 transcriptional regulator, LysR family protein [Mycolicibacterium smegmatis MKD8
MRHLRCFVVLAEELHFGRAAQRLHVAQPALSQLIQRVERELGAQLFLRTRRTVSLTEAGQTLLPEARRILRDADRVTQAVRAVHRGETGSVTIGFVGSAADDVLPRLVAAHRRHHPGVSIRLEEGTTAQQLEWLRDQRITVGLGRTPIDDPAVSTVVLARESLVLAVPDSHALSGAESAELAGLAEEPFIMFPRHLGPGLYDIIHSACAAAGFTPSVVYETVRMQTIVGLVSGGLGVALVPESVRNLGRKGVRYVHLADAPPAIELSMMWRNDCESPHLQPLRKTARHL